MKRKTITTFGLFVMAVITVATLAGAGAAARPAGNGAVTFVDSGQALGAANSHDVALEDLDGDGDLDAFVANHTQASAVWLNQGGAQGGSEGAFADSGQSLGDGRARALALGDLDGDGDQDAFVVLDFGADPNQVWINQGGDQGGSPGQFAPNGQAMGDDNSDGVALGDLDGDGDLDAFVTRFLRPDKVWLNQGGAQGGSQGLFADSGQSLGDQNGYGVALADVDGDGDLDAFVANSGPDKVWLNNGGAQGGNEGAFVDSGQSLVSDTVSNAVALADIDGVSSAAAFVAHAGFDTLWVNTGGVYSDSGQTLDEGISTDVALDDLDGDGDLDVFVANYEGNTVWVNQGGVQGGAPGDYVGNGQRLGDAYSEGLALGDVDGDGDVDAFVANYFVANRVWLNEALGPAHGVDLSISVSGTTYIDAPPPGYAKFDVTVENLGPDPATGVTVHGYLEDTFSNASQGECAHDIGGLCDEWLFGNLAPGQSATVDYGPLNGRYFSNEDEVIHDVATATVSVTGAEWDTWVDNNSDSFTTYFYDCSYPEGDCFLVFEFCQSLPSTFAFAGTMDAVHAGDESVNRAEAGQAFSGRPRAYSLAGLLRPLGEPLVDLAVYYLLRDDVLMGTADGRHYVDLYYTHDPEIQTLLDADPDLESQGIATLQVWEPNLWALVGGNGDSATISAEQVQVADDFLTNLSAVASPELQEAIAEERARLGPPEAYVDMTMDEARGIVVGYGLYVPLVVDE